MKEMQENLKKKLKILNFKGTLGAGTGVEPVTFSQ